MHPHLILLLIQKTTNFEYFIVRCMTLLLNGMKIWKLFPISRLNGNKKAVKELVFQLRQDAVFHHGDQLTAEDVKFSIERMVDPTNEERFLLPADSTP